MSRRFIASYVWLRRVFSTPSNLVPLLGMLLLMGHLVQSLAQEGKPSQAEIKRAKTPPPSNPLVLINPLDNSGNERPLFDEKGNRRIGRRPSQSEFGDYNQVDDPRFKKPIKPLQVFGYSFFAWARQSIDARRFRLTGGGLQGGPKTGKSETQGTGENGNIGNNSNNGNGDPNLPPKSSDEKGKPGDLLNGAQKGKDITLTDAEKATLLSQAGSDPATAAELQREQRRKALLGVNDDPANKLAAGQIYSPNGVANDHPQEPLNAFRDIADPMTQLYRNVIATVPTNYQLAAGDTLVIRYSTPAQGGHELSVLVDPQGRIGLEGIGSLVVRGMNLAQAENAVKLRLSRFYRNLEVSVSLKELRTIQVTVGGEAYAPGGYVVPAITGVFNLLYAAGGPTEEGSLRRIEVIRHGKTIGTLDFYKFLMTGEQGEIPLQTGDIIYIPPSQSRITVRGEVRFQAIFEINEKENLADILRYAGGVKASGVQQLVQVTTIDPGNSRILKNIPLKEAVQSKLYDEDVVTIFSLRPLVTNRVTIEGAVDQPNDYALSAGMRVADLVELARGTIAEAYPFRAELYRWNSDNSTTLTVIDLEKAMARNPEANLPLQRWDRLKVYTMEDVAWAGIRKVEVRGAVTKPGYYEYSRNMHISDLLRKVGGPLPDATLVVLLHQRGDGTYKYEYSRVAEISASNTAKDSLIEDNDLLAVYRTGEDQFTPDHNVLIRGEVISPGLYKRAEGMKLSNLLQLCGGFTPKAGSSVVLAHARKPVDGITADWKTQTVEFDSQHRATNDLVLEDGDVIIVQGTGGFQDKPAIITVNGAVRKPGPIILESKNMRLSDAIAKAGGLRPEAFTAGAEFIREPQNLTSTGQRDLAGIINDLNNLLNESDYKRENAKAEVDRIKAGLGSSPSALSDISNGAKNPATAVAIASQLSTHNLVTPPRVLKDKDLEPNGNIAINLTNALNKPKGSDDLILLDGDVINIRAKPTTVQVIGGVINPRGVLFKPGERLEYYIDATGGFAPDAAKDRLVVIRPGGGLIPIKRLREFNAGDLILVPTKVLAAKISNNTNLLDSVFRGITSSAILYRLATGIFGL